MDPDLTTVTIYRKDKRILMAIAKKEDLRDLKNHPSVKEAIHFILQGMAA